MKMIQCKAAFLLLLMICGAVVLFPLVGLAQADDEQVSIGLTCGFQEGDVSLAVSIRNAAEMDTAIFLGVILGNGRKYLANELYLEVRGPSGTEKYHYSDPSVPAIAGRVDAWVVTLPVKANFLLTRPRGHFFAGGAQLSDKEEPYAIRVSFDARAIPEDLNVGIPSFRTYRGRLESEWVQIPESCTTEQAATVAAF
jgi:hypothetical protein